MGAMTKDDYKNGEDNHECINTHTTTKVFISLNGGETLMNLCNAFGLKIRSDPFNRGNLNNVRDRFTSYRTEETLTAPESILKPSVRSKCLLVKKAFRADSPETTMTVS